MRTANGARVTGFGAGGAAAGGAIAGPFAGGTFSFCRVAGRTGRVARASCAHYCNTCTYT